jgi:hypothetical protein
MMTDPEMFERFHTAAHRFGLARAMRIYENERKKDIMKSRMTVLGFLTAILFIIAMFTSTFLLILVMFVIQMATLEARRFVGCGRTYKCNYSMEVMGI